MVGIPDTFRIVALHMYFSATYHFTRHVSGKPVIRPCGLESIGK
jgi:hypothetical protein